MSVFGNWWNRIRGRDEVPPLGASIAAAGVGAAVVDDKLRGDEHEGSVGDHADYGWSGDHLSGGSDYGGGGGDFGGGGFDGGGGDAGGGF